MVIQETKQTNAWGPVPENPKSKGGLLNTSQVILVFILGFYHSYNIKGKDTVGATDALVLGEY